MYTTENPCFLTSSTTHCVWDYKIRHIKMGDIHMATLKFIQSVIKIALTNTWIVVMLPKTFIECFYKCTHSYDWVRDLSFCKSMGFLQRVLQKLWRVSKFDQYFDNFKYFDSDIYIKWTNKEIVVAILMTTFTCPLYSSWYRLSRTSWFV